MKDFGKLVLCKYKETLAGEVAAWPGVAAPNITLICPYFDIDGIGNEGKGMNVALPINDARRLLVDLAKALAMTGDETSVALAAAFKKVFEEKADAKGVHPNA